MIDFWIIVGQFGTPDIPRWLYLQFLTRNPNLRSKNANFRARRGKIRKTNVKLLFSIFLFFTFDLFTFEPRVRKVRES